MSEKGGMRGDRNDIAGISVLRFGRRPNAFLRRADDRLSDIGMDDD